VATTARVQDDSNEIDTSLDFAFLVVVLITTLSQQSRADRLEYGV
jgi:hypothetical protein